MDQRDNPPPYSAAAPPGVSPPPPGFQPPLEQMKPPYSSPDAQPQYHQHQSYHQPQHQATTTHVIINPGPIVCFGPNPQHMVCPSCHAQISTSVKTEPNTKTHIFALILCLLQCYCCCCIPYCVDSCQSQNHYCPHCQAFLGSYQN